MGIGVRGIAVKLWRILIQGLMGLAAITWLSAASATEIVTTTILPLTMDQKKDPGFIVELVQEIQKQQNRHDPIRFMVWANAYDLASRRDDKMIGPLSRTPEREKQFTWIVYLLDLAHGFMSVRESINSLEHAKTLSKVAVYEGTVMETFLRQSGFTNLVVSQPETAARLLREGKVDAWYSTLTEAGWVWKLTGRGMELKMGAPITRTQVWLAGSKNFDPEVVKQYQKGMDVVIKNGTYRVLLDKYLGSAAQSLGRRDGISLAH